jgi:hypothetical protein
MNMRSSAPRDGTKKQSLASRISDRLIGFPKISVRYRAHWRIMKEAHHIILALIDDSQRGARARSVYAMWLEQRDQ